MLLDIDPAGTEIEATARVGRRAFQSPTTSGPANPHNNRAPFEPLVLVLTMPLGIADKTGNGGSLRVLNAAGPVPNVPLATDVVRLDPVVLEGCPSSLLALHLEWPKERVANHWTQLERLKSLSEMSAKV